MSGPPSDQDPQRHLAVSMAQRSHDQGQQVEALPPHSCSRGPPASSQGLLPVPQPALQAGPRGPRAAFLALSLCWLGRKFLLENSRILPMRPQAWPGNLGGREVRDAPTNRVWSCGSRGSPGILGHQSFPTPRAGAPNLLPSSSDAPLGPLHWNPGLCSWGCHTGD